MQGVWLPDTSTYDIEHEVAHHDRVSHHHDNDGSMHYDASTESSQHASDHACCHVTAALPPTFFPILDIAPSRFLDTHVDADLPEGFHERPQRPPSVLG